MAGLENITSKIENNEKEINKLNKNIDTDEQLKNNQKTIKKIYNDIGKISNNIAEIQDENTKKEYKDKILKIKREFADLMSNRILDWEFKDINDERRFDVINKQYISELEDIVKNNFDSINITKIDVNNIKNELINTNTPYETIESINNQLTDEEKIILLKEISNEDIPPEYITLIAWWFWFESWLILAWENWFIKLSYIKYWSWCIIIWEWKIVDWKDYEDAYQKYIIENKSEIKNKVDGINTYDKSTLYESDTSDIEKREKIQKAQMDDIENWITPEEYEFVQKIWVFTTIWLKWWKDSIKAELYWKWTTWWSDVSLWYWWWISWIHKTDNKTKFTTTFWITGNLINFSSTNTWTDETWAEVITWGLQREPTKAKYSIKEKISFSNWLTIWWTLSTKDFNKIQTSVYWAYTKWNTEVWAWITTNIKNWTPWTPTATMWVTFNL